MSALQNLAENLSNQFKDLATKIQDSPAFQQIKEKYDDLPSTQQKLVLALTLGIVIFFVFSIPYDNWSRSDESLTQFETERNLINQLHLVMKESSEGTVYTPAPPVGQVKTDLEMRLQQFQLVAEQIGNIQVDMSSTANVIPLGSQEGSIKLPLKKLNLRQLVDIVTELQRMHMGVKLVNFKVDSNLTDPRYLDALLDFIVIKVPQIQVEAETNNNATKPRKPK
jgi:hypothetical protein